MGADEDNGTLSKWFHPQLVWGLRSMSLSCQLDFGELNLNLFSQRDYQTQNELNRRQYPEWFHAYGCLSA